MIMIIITTIIVIIIIEIVIIIIIIIKVVLVVVVVVSILYISGRLEHGYINMLEVIQYRYLISCNATDNAYYRRHSPYAGIRIFWIWSRNVKCCCFTASFVYMGGLNKTSGLRR